MREVDMTPILDANLVLTTLYCLIDDALRALPQTRPVRPGPNWRLSDSEVLTLAVLAQFQPQLSERALLAWVAQRFPGAFPRLPDQSGYNRHLHDLWGVLAWLGPAIARQAQAHLPHPARYHVVDGSGVPLLSMRRGGRGRTYGDAAAIGRGGVDRGWFYGAKLALEVCDQGLIHGFVSGPANTEERFLAEALWQWQHDPNAPTPSADALLEVLGPTHRAGGQRQGPSGPLGPRFGAGAATRHLMLGDAGYAGAAWQRHWQQAWGVHVVTRQQAAAQDLAAWFSGQRQVVESVYARLHEQFDLAWPRSKGVRGWWRRLSAKVAAQNLQIVCNALWQRPLGTHLDVLALP